MAIFEKSNQTRTLIDDTEKLSCTLENAHSVNKHTEYVLQVRRGYNEENKWTVSRRYRDFSSLHASLQQANIELPLPPKKLIGNMQPSFIAERQIALQNYIKKVLEHPILALSLPVRSFLDPQNYSTIIAERALQTVSIALRGDGQYELKGPLPDIGWRVRKHYFSVTESGSGTNCLLSFQSYGPDKHLSNKDLQTAFKSLQNLSHPNIAEILSLHTLETGAYVVRRIYEKGSLRDMLYGTEYNKCYLSKYGNPKVRKPLTLGQLAHYGYQILQALKFLNDKGIPHGHLHPGNIAIDNQRAVLLDIENSLLGVPCLYRPYLVKCKRVNRAPAIDVYCFGRTMYELATAKPLDGYCCDVFENSISMGAHQDLENLLRMCISSVMCRHGSVSYNQLLCHSFFTRASLNGVTDRTHLKFPLSLKDQLRLSVTAMEERLREDQNMQRKAKKEVRIQELLSSDVEMKRQQKRAKKRESVWKSTSSLAETHSGSTVSSPTPPAPPPPPPPQPASDSGRSALLQDICNFDRSRLAGKGPAR
ncbi:PX domain-containing protein kinase-like protein [Aricia agestis]|uniref:PX domain-containing protein kinase-like protein n=1 Tax=Aricia agestis TaxID=91739 RepID=UPI001C20A8C9|nr:PX domain-containing protein kinase-like protein [Aricia agestis]